MARNAPVSAVPLCATIGNFAGFYFLRFQQANMKKKALNSRFKHFELFRLSLEKLDLYRDNKMSIIRNFMDFL